MLPAPAAPLARSGALCLQRHKCSVSPIPASVTTYLLDPYLLFFAFDLNFQPNKLLRAHQLILVRGFSSCVGPIFIARIPRAFDFCFLWVGGAKLAPTGRYVRAL